jgi:regulator of sirC expression with transglutaminase-like and TPR domain
MSPNWPVPTPHQYFTMLVQNDDELPLLEAAASLAQDSDPALDLQQVLDDMDQLERRLKRSVKAGSAAIERLHGLNRFFFSALGFAGNVNDYYSADNSYLHVVLNKRRGIPISLAVLWLELARSLGLKSSGVNFPGHFLVQTDVGVGRVVIDPFTGQSLSERDLVARLEAWAEERMIASRDEGIVLARHLNAATPREILVRMLRNLQAIHRAEAHWALLVAVQDRMITLLPQAWAEYRERGLALAELGERERARADLSRYLSQVADADDRSAMVELLEDLGGWVQ